MKVWARYAVPVMVLVDEQEDSIERVVMLPGERFIDRETMGDMLFYTEQLEQISSSRQQAAHALYVGDTDRWPDAAEWEIEETFDALAGLVDEQRNPTCPDCDGEATTRPTVTAIPTAYPAEAAPRTPSSTETWAVTPTSPNSTSTASRGRTSNC